MQKKIKSGKLSTGNKDADPFELFIASTDIRYCYYKETHKILGNTYGMCILQVRPFILLLILILSKNKFLIKQKWYKDQKGRKEW